jgi:hypothetical protein
MRRLQPSRDGREDVALEKSTGHALWPVGILYRFTIAFKREVTLESDTQYDEVANPCYNGYICYICPVCTLIHHALGVGSLANARTALASELRAASLTRPSHLDSGH